MKKLLLVGTSLSGLMLSGALAFSPAEVDALMQQQLGRFDVPGVGLAIVQNGRVVYSKGYGVRDLKTGASVNADTLFAIGSSSKSFTALGIMQQVEAGKLKLDEPIGTYLPNLKFSDPNKAKQVTLRRLLSMSSGLPRADELWATTANLKTRQQMLQTIAQIPFNTEVGKVFQYCNQNFIAAGAALEQVSGSTWEAYTKANILAPIGMKRTVFGWDDASKDSNHASGSLVGFDGAQPIPAFDRFEIVGPAGSIHSSANEMGRYLAFQLGTGRAGGRTVALPESLRLMHTQEIAISKPSDPSFSGYGLGWFTSEYRGVKVVEHGGNINGFTAAMQLLPEKRLGFVLLTNQNGANEFTETTSRGLTELLLNMQPRSNFADSGYSATRALVEQTKTYKPSVDQYKALEGNYALVTGDKLRVFVQDGKLYGDQGGQVFELKAASSNQYVVDIGGFVLAIEFQTGANGLVWLYQEGTVVGVRLPAASAASAAATTFKDPQGRYSVVLPAELQVVQAQPFLVAETAQATFLFLNGAAKPTLEGSAQALLQQLEPSFDLKPSRQDALPAINGVVWTQLLYALPQNQTLAVLITQRGNLVYAIALQAETKNINAAASILQQLLLSYQIL